MLRGILIGLFWGAVVSAIGLGVTSLINDPPQLITQEPPVKDLGAALQSDASADGALTPAPRPSQFGGLIEDEAQNEAASEADQTSTVSPELEADDAPAIDGGVETDASDPNTGGNDVLLTTSADDDADDADKAAEILVTEPAAMSKEEPSQTSDKIITSQQAVRDTDASDTIQTVASGDDIAPDDNQSAMVTLPASDDTEPSAPAKAAASQGALEPTKPEIAPLVPPQDPMTEAPSQDIVILLEDDGAAPIMPAPSEPKIANLPTVNGTGGGATFAASGSTFAAEGSSFATQGVRDTVGQTLIPERDVAPEESLKESHFAPLRHSAEAVETQGKPLFSIILEIDDPAQPGPETMVAFPYPVSFAVSLDLPDAARKVELMRDLGYEAFVMPSFPENAEIKDVITSLELQSSHDIEAVGLIERRAGDFTSTLDISNEVIAYANAHHMALLFHSKGLNSALTHTRKEGIPAADIFRSFSHDNLSTDRMRRSLDQAVLRAAVERPVIVTGRLTAQTISALILWGLQDRASRVALVPASQILHAQ